MSFSNPPPPSYGSSLKLSLLCLDGGGTRTLVQLQILCELMHRLAWDMDLISSRPSIPQKCQVYPADCFDYIGAGGCGAIIAYLLAAGHTASTALEHFLKLTPILASTKLHAPTGIAGSSTYPGESLVELAIALDACLPRHDVMQSGNDFVVDIPSRTGVWIATPSFDNGNPSNGRGVFIPKGSPIRLSLLPLVLAEVEREMRGDQVGLEHTLEFLQAVCPVFDDCGMLCVLGSGEVPVTTAPAALPRIDTGHSRSHVRSAAAAGKEKECPAYSMEKHEEKVEGKERSTDAELATSSCWLAGTIVYLLTWLCYTTTTTTSSSIFAQSSVAPQSPAPLPPTSPCRERSRALNAYVPTHTYGRSYIRLSPDLTTRVTGGELRKGLTTSSKTSNQSTQAGLAWPTDWEPEHFSEHRMLTSSYCGKADIGIAMDRVVDVLGRREFPGVLRRDLHPRRGSGASTSTSANWGSSSARTSTSAGWGSAPQYCLAAGNGNGRTAKGRAEALTRALEDKRRLDAIIFQSAGYVF